MPTTILPTTPPPVNSYLLPLPTLSSARVRPAMGSQQILALQDESGPNPFALHQG